MHIQLVPSAFNKNLSRTKQQEALRRNGIREFSLPWRQIRDRLNCLDPNWQVGFSDPVTVSDYITVRCKLTIAGVTREATGSNKGYTKLFEREKSRIDAPERAMVNALINAATQFGINTQSNNLLVMAEYPRRNADKLQPNHKAKKEEIMEVVQMLRTLQQKRKSPIRAGFHRLFAVLEKRSGHSKRK